MQGRDVSLELDDTGSIWKLTSRRILSHISYVGGLAGLKPPRGGQDRYDDSACKIHQIHVSLPGCGCIGRKAAHRSLIASAIGKDATAIFNGGVYDHSNAAHNLLSTMRIGVLRGGCEVEAWKQVCLEKGAVFELASMPSTSLELKNH